MNNTREKIKDIVNTLNKWAQEYYQQDKPTVSDAEYDGLYNTLVDLETRHPELIESDSPTQRIGGKLDNRFNKVSHKYPMLSLGNAFNNDDLINFDKQIKDKLKSKEELEYVLEYKIDGLSISLLYEKGNLIQALTRGDGSIGEDVTHNIFQIKSIPKKISFKKSLEVRGEVYMPNKVFEELNKKGANFANPRNAAAGSLRQLDSAVARERSLEAFLYQIPNPEELGFSSHKETLDFLKDQGFKTNDKTMLVDDINKTFSLIEDMTNKRDVLDYEVDGVVIKVNNIKLYETIGYTVKAPKYMIAYKFPEEVSQTLLIDIFPTVGRTGRITYNAKLSPVRLAGTTVAAATLHNADYIIEKNIAIGDIVSVKKAGEIIPKVLGFIKKNNNEKWLEATHCPSCGSELVRNQGEVDQYCLNGDCPAKNQAKFEHFVSRGAMNIEGVSSEVLRTFIEKGYITDIVSIYKLKNFREDLINLAGFKAKSVDNILESIEKSKEQDLSKFLFGMGIRHLGEKNSRVITKTFGSLENISKASIEDITNIKDLGPKVAKSVYDFFRNQNNLNQILELINLGVSLENQSEKKSNIFKNKTFVITGTLSKSRNHFKQVIEEHNGNVSGSISKNTTYLLAGSSAGSKLSKAKSLDVPIISEEDFAILIKENKNG